MKIKFDQDDELPFNKTMQIFTMTIATRAIFMKIANIIHKIFQTNVCIKYKIESKDELKEIDIKYCTCYYFDNIIKDRDTYLVDILLDEKLYENISVYNISYKTSMSPKSLRIWFDKIDGFIRVRGHELRRLVLFDYGLFDKFMIRLNIFYVKKVVLLIVIVIILEKSKLIHIFLYLLKKY